MTTFTYKQLCDARCKLEPGFGRSVKVWWMHSVRIGVLRDGSVRPPRTRGCKLIVNPNYLESLCVQDLHLWANKLHLDLGNDTNSVHFWEATNVVGGQHRHRSGEYTLTTHAQERLASALIVPHECPDMGPNFLKEYARVWNKQFQTYEPIFAEACEATREEAVNLKALLDIQHDEM